MRETLHNFYEERGMEIQIRIYPDGYSLIPDVDTPMDLILLDTRLSDLNGYIIAELLRTRRSKRDSLIVFLGDPKSDVYEAFSYLPFGYIRKDHWAEESGALLARLWRYDHRERSVEVVYQRKRKRVRVSSIMYIEGQGHSLTVFCTQGENYRFRGRMAEYEALLDGYYFVRSAKSFLVNCAYVRGITNRVELKNGCEIPCSKSCTAQTRQMWDRYMQEMARGL
jgi:DNA-binding LytR/AlgR family response regulator